MKASALIVTNRMIDQFVKVHGKLTTIVSDHGVQFISHIWQSRLTELGIQVLTTSVYYPQSNPSERVMREVGRLFRTYCHEKHTSWFQYIHYIELVLNNTVHESTGSTLQEIFMRTARYHPFGILVETPPDRKENPNTQYILAREIQNNKAEPRNVDIVVREFHPVS
ncbi:Ribonuclease H-like domain,Integrase, catalytic core [Cinara cedri]|uniref:Ribonuclease H-like domain,Integrase, catalytic core n=1 Tax=Cinara cedri TaxID=506608 RepID=A0A5E4NF19_9HEMI|nr:Ribonuclease H-like domain,Integrase, catalytic core [Cinara cedri]